MLSQGKLAMEAAAVQSAILLLQPPQAAIPHLPRAHTHLPTRHILVLTTAAQTRGDQTLEARTRAGQTPVAMAGAPRSHPGEPTPSCPGTGRFGGSHNKSCNASVPVCTYMLMFALTPLACLLPFVYVAVECPDPLEASWDHQFNWSWLM
jgi:hypothetical protein